MGHEISEANVKLDKIKIDHKNAQSLLCHLDEILILVEDRNPDILCISETWLLPYVDDKFISIPNFYVFRHDKGKGGGVCIYVREFFKCSQNH